jgi:hypothetical protein
LIAVSIFATSARSQTGAYTDGKAAGLNAEQIALLRALNAAIAVPTYIPKDFRLHSLVIEDPYSPETVGYVLVYRNGEGRSFAMQSANEGIGDVSETRLTGRNRYFEGRVMAGVTGDEEEGLFVSWIGSRRAYQPRGSLQQFYSLAANMTDLSLREALRVMESLRHLRR